VIDPVQEPARVTIVVATRDRASADARETIDSVLHDHPGVELLVADDLRSGFERAGGDFIAYLSAGDRLMPDAVRKLATALGERPDAVAAIGGFELLDEGRAVTGRVAARDWSAASALRLHLCPAGPAALLRRSIVERIGGLDGNLVRLGELDLWFRLLLEGPVVPVDGTLGRRRTPPAKPTADPIARRERPEIVERLYGREGLPPEVAAIRAEALAAAYVTAGLEGEAPVPEVTRFGVFDREAELARANGQPGTESALGTGELAEAARLLAALGERAEEIERLRDRVGQIDAELGDWGAGGNGHVH
jgi:hypothetical protein